MPRSTLQSPFTALQSSPLRHFYAIHFLSLRARRFEATTLPPLLRWSSPARAVACAPVPAPCGIAPSCHPCTAHAPSDRRWSCPIRWYPARFRLRPLVNAAHEADWHGPRDGVPGVTPAAPSWCWCAPRVFEVELCAYPKTFVCLSFGVSGQYYLCAWRGALLLGAIATPPGYVPLFSWKFRLQIRKVGFGRFQVCAVFVPPVLCVAQCCVCIWA